MLSNDFGILQSKKDTDRIKQEYRILTEFISKYSRKEDLEKDIEMLAVQKNTNLIEKENLENKNEALNLEYKEYMEKIERDIPKQAKKVILQENLLNQYNLLMKTSESISNIQKEMDDISNFTIPAEIEKMIENEIRPSYIITQKQDKYKNYLLLLTTTIIISSIIFSTNPYIIPNYLRNSIFIIISVLTLYILLKLVLLTFLPNYQFEQIKIKKIVIKIAYIVTILILFVFTLLNALLFFYDKSYSSMALGSIIIFLVLISYLICRVTDKNPIKFIRKINQK